MQVAATPLKPKATFPVADLPTFRRTCARIGVVCVGQAGREACNQTCWISSSDALAP